MIQFVLLTLDHLIRRRKSLLCPSLQNGIVDDQKNLVFETKPQLFSIGVIGYEEFIVLL
jgi:hypothetical protein